MDPLAARSADARIVVAQVHEPLVARSAAPYGGPPRPTGLAVALRPSAGQTVWTVQLRPGVRFRDGTPFNAAAVIANSRRWTSLPAGRSLLPELFAVDSPRPGEVRFLLSRPVRDLPRRLADPRLGIASPRALDPQTGERARYRPGAHGGGTGAFTLAGRPDGGELARNPDWWGADLGLGPALDSVRFIPLPAAVERVAALRAGRVHVAGFLPARTLRFLGADPLLTSAPQTAGGVAMSAAVRGLAGQGAAPRLSAVWLTTILD